MILHVDTPSHICSVDETDEDWFIDNGATKHVSNRTDIYKSFAEFSVPHTVSTAGGETLKAIGKGNVEVVSRVGNHQYNFTLGDVWYVPGIQRNLFSVLAAQDRNSGSTEFRSTATSCSLTVRKRRVLHGSRSLGGSLFKAHITAVKSNLEVGVNLMTDDVSKMQLYHERFGHQDKRHVREVVKRELLINLKVNNELCTDCIYGKAHRLKFGTREQASKPGELISADACGPFDESFSRCRYLEVFKDNYSK
jgi:hypothetical protein